MLFLESSSAHFFKFVLYGSSVARFAQFDFLSLSILCRTSFGNCPPPPIKNIMVHPILFPFYIITSICSIFSHAPWHTPCTHHPHRAKTAPTLFPGFSLFETAHACLACVSMILPRALCKFCYGFGGRSISELLFCC